MNVDKDYYGILEIPTTASEDEIKEQYKFLMKAWHPDRFSSAEHNTKAEEKSKEINEANDVLSNPVQREMYDRARKTRASNGRTSAASPPPSPPNPPKLVVFPKSLNFGVLLVGGRWKKSFKIDNRGGVIPDGKLEVRFSEEDAWFSISIASTGRSSFPVEVEVTIDTRELEAGQRYEGWIEVLGGSATATVDISLDTKDEDAMKEQIVVSWDPPEAANADFYYDLKPGVKRRATLQVVPKFPGAGSFTVHVAGPLPSWIKVSPMVCTPPARLAVEVEAPRFGSKDEDEWTGVIDLEIVLDD